jgi:ATP-dependent Clp protease ATP-binding subunit ClpB
VGFGGSVSDMTRERAMKALGEFLRPEFMNRVDEVICFNQLTEEDFRAIARIMLGEVRDVLQERSIAFRWDESVADMLVHEAYSVTYGARELRRVIQKKIEDPLAEEMVRARDTVIQEIFVSAAEDGLKIDLA